MKLRTLDRREFLVGTAASAALAAPAYAPTLAAQAYVWTQQFRKEGKTLAEGGERMIKGMTGAGFRAAELMSQFFEPDLAPTTSSLLKKYKLAVPVVYCGGVFHDASQADKTVESILKVAASAKAAGAKAINTNANPKPKRDRKSDAELETQLAAINRLGAALAKQGMRLQFHQHDPEMREDAREWRHLLRGTDPKHIDVCLDLHWVLRGGLVPMTILKEAAPRLASLHLRNSRNGVWSEDFSDGEIDYRAVAAFLRNIGYRGLLVVELAYENATAVTRSLEENLKSSHAYARQVFLGD